jgi:bacterioferritin-associated ferredoxin
VFVCICARVRECELRAAIRGGARDEHAVGRVCGAGTNCGTCLDRVDEILAEEHTAPDTLVGANLLKAA